MFAELKGPAARRQEAWALEVIRVLISCDFVEMITQLRSAQMRSLPTPDWTFAGHVTTGH